jgi:hypothetical protein
MSIERTYYCDGPENPQIPGDDPQPDGCPHNVTALVVDEAYLPGGVIEVRQHTQGATYVTNHFCSWDCLFRFAAAKHPVECIEGGRSDG